MAKGKKTGGGSRKGVPNKSTAEVKEIMDSIVEWNVVVEKMYSLVKGIMVQKTNEKDGTVYVEDKEPNVQAAKLLLEYRFGKPKEQIDIKATETIERVELVVVHKRDGKKEDA